MLRKILRLTALIGGALLGGVAALAALMVVVRAPSFFFFGLGLVALEWAPWMLLLAGIACLLTGLGRRAAGRTLRLGLLGLSSGALLAVAAVWCLALTQPPAVTTNIDPLAALAPGSFEARAFFRPSTFEEVVVTRDVIYDRVEGQPLMLDVYTPPVPAAGGSPALVVVHGGSWRGGGKGEFAEQSKAWAAAGYVVFDIAYRLAPQDRFPAAVQDVQCALAFIEAEASRFGHDPGRLALVGRSAGAQIALVVAYAGATPDLAPRCMARYEGVRAVVGYYAPTRMSYYDIIQPELSPGALDDYLGGSPEAFPEAYRLARPATWVGPSTPATLLLHGRCDQFVRILDPLALGEALAAAGRPYGVMVLPWANHGFDFNRTGTSNQRVQPFVDAFLDHFVRKARGVG